MMFQKNSKRYQVREANGIPAMNMCTDTSTDTVTSNHVFTERRFDSTKSDKSPNAKDRWGRLKTTVNAISHVHVKKKNGLNRGDSFLRKFSTRQTEDKIEFNSTNRINYASREKNVACQSLVIHPAGEIMFYWLGIVTVAVLYNLWTCIARETFREIQNNYNSVWFSLDALCDFIYIMDIFVQFRTGYLLQGLMVYNTQQLCKNYMKNPYFIVDLVCLLPLDFLQFSLGIHPMLRFPRFLKVYRSVRFMHVYESRTAYPNLLRVLSLSHILFLGAHWFAAFYYLISEAEGFNGGWAYPTPEGQYASVTRKYLASLYWSTLTLTTIGDLPPPDTNWQATMSNSEYAFVIMSYLIGVFIFATIVGQVGNVITNRNASRQEFERLLDGAKFYMQTHDVPKDLQKRVQRWYDYVWTRGRLNCNDINSLGLLPDKLKTELALHVNLGTLRQVTIFQKCRPEFLHDLMLKMRAYIFTPGDLICRRGEVAREMFIIADGVVEILGESATVLTQMSTGDFFGEIGILNLDGGINRRTADVVSVGYSELFVLSREDVLAALKDHPDAEKILTEFAQDRLNEMETHRKSKRQSKRQFRTGSIEELVTGLFDNACSRIRSHKNWRHINVDKTILQPCMPAAQGVFWGVCPKILFAGALNFQIIREYGQRRLRETEEHRKLIKSAPNSPQPDSRRRYQNKEKTETNNHIFHLPQLKCIPKLAGVSPRLRRVLSLKNSIKIKRHRRKSQQRRKSSDERQIALALEKLHHNIKSNLGNEDFDHDETEDDEEHKCDTNFSRTTMVQNYGHTLAVPSLKVINERNSASETDSDDFSDKEVRPKQDCRFADVVINLLRKTKREQEYIALSTNDDDHSVICNNNTKIDNISEGDAGLCNSHTNVRKVSLDEVQTSRNSFKHTLSCNTQRESPKIETHKLKCSARPEDAKTIPVPKIVLSRDTNMSSSESDSSNEADGSIKKPQARNLSKPSSTLEMQTNNILKAPLHFDRHSRRISCPPPLDLPIEVPRMSRFRGLSPANTDLQDNLNTFKETFTRRLSSLEKSYRQTIHNLEDTSRRQEDMLKEMMQRLTNISTDPKTESEQPSSSTGSTEEVTYL